jgi:hypothetical protein
VRAPDLVVPLDAQLLTLALDLLGADEPASPQRANCEVAFADDARVRRNLQTM